jgi:molybdenum-dependent DNA-binding transcriptional regulator ModE
LANKSALMEEESKKLNLNTAVGEEILQTIKQAEKHLSKHFEDHKSKAMPEVSQEPLKQKTKDSTSIGGGGDYIKV